MLVRASGRRLLDSELVFGFAVNVRFQISGSISPSLVLPLLVSRTANNETRLSIIWTKLATDRLVTAASQSLALST